MATSETILNHHEEDLLSVDMINKLIILNYSITVIMGQWYCDNDSGSKVFM